MIPLFMFTYIFCKNIKEKDVGEEKEEKRENEESYIDIVRELEDELKTLFKDDPEFRSGSNLNLASYGNSENLNPMVNVPSTKSNRLAKEIGKKVIFGGTNSKIGNDVLKNEILEQNPALKHWGSLIPRIPLNSGKMDVVSSALNGLNDHILNDKIPIPSSKAVVGSVIRKIKNDLAAISARSNHIIPELEGLNVLDKDIIYPIKKLEEDLDGFPDKKDPTMPSKPSKPSKKKFTFINENPAEDKRLDELNKKAIVRGLLPKKERENAKVSADPQQPDAFTTEKDSEETIKKLKSENESLKEQIAIDLMEKEALAYSLGGNILESELLRGNLPAINRKFVPKLPILKLPFNNHLSTEGELIMGESIMANLNAENARILHNNAAIDKKEANSLKTSAEVDNMVARELGPSSLGTMIKDEGIIDNLFATALDEKAKNEKTNSDLLSNLALDKIKNVRNTVIADDLELIGI